MSPSNQPFEPLGRQQKRASSASLARRSRSRWVKAARPTKSGRLCRLSLFALLAVMMALAAYR